LTAPKDLVTKTGLSTELSAVFCSSVLIVKFFYQGYYFLSLKAKRRRAQRNKRNLLFIALINWNLFVRGPWCRYVIFLIVFGFVF